MKDSQIQLQHFIVNEFMTKCNVSKIVATEDMNVMMSSYAYSALISLIDYPEQDVKALKAMFIDEIKYALSSKHPNHVSFVKSISTNIYTKANKLS